MRFRSCLAGMLAIFLTLFPAGAIEEPAASGIGLHRVSNRQALLASRSAKAANRQTFLPESSEFCLTLDSPGIAERLKQGEDALQADQTVVCAQQAVIHSVGALGGAQIVAQNSYLVNTITVRVPADQVNALHSLPGVAQITGTTRYTLPVLPAVSDMAQSPAASILAGTAQDGQGQVIAVIDTGIDLGHEAMTLSDPASAKLSEDDAATLIRSMGYGAYYSAKIPFYYNYADGNTAMRDETNDQHGMHVAGICAGNSAALQGAAPQAQILAMRVFGEGSDTAADYAIVAAIEDAVRLGADVINLSLGSSFGFSTLGSEPYQQAVKAAREHGVVIVAAAGNDGRSDVDASGGSAASVLGLSLADNATVSAPACYDGFFSVAAAKNNRELASFSSFGPAPDLSFAPFLTAPGMNIRSCVNDNQYASKSGTSMATPAVSGAFAALAQSLDAVGLLPEGQARVNRLHALLMNTAQPMTSQQKTVSVRGQGAGLLDLAAARDCRVTAISSNGLAAVELGEIDTTNNRSIEIPITLFNFGSAPVTYEAIQQPVLTEETGSASMTCQDLSKAQMEPPAGGVTLQSGETATVVFTLRLEAGTRGYVEGYLHLRGTGGEPDLSIPYLGYAGKWAEPMAITSGEYAPMFGSLSPESEQPVLTQTAVLSPNGDGYNDAITPLYYQLRNAQRTEYAIYDDSGRCVSEIMRCLGTPKDNYTDLRGQSLLEKPDFEQDTVWFFDGMVWDPLTDRYRLLEDGVYAMRITLTCESGTASQTIEIPFIVDARAPLATQENVYTERLSDVFSPNERNDPAVSNVPTAASSLEWVTPPPTIIDASTPGFDAATGRLSVQARCPFVPQTLRYANGLPLNWSAEPDDPTLLNIELEVKEGYQAFTIEAIAPAGLESEHLSGAYYADLTPPDIHFPLSASTAQWLPPYIDGLLPVQGTPREITIDFTDNQPYGMVCSVNDTLVYTGQQSRLTETFSVDAREGALLWISCADATGNLVQMAYLATDRDWQRGDINGDGSIDAADALLVLQHSVQLVCLSAVEQAVGDVNGDACPDARDALLMLQYSVGLRTEL